MLRGKVVCPRRSKPQVVKAITDKYTAWKVTLKWGGGKSTSRTKGRKTVEYNDLDKKLHKENEADHPGDVC
jgi:hypothetical protein